MPEVAKVLDKAHARAAAASGLVVAMIARKKFNRALCAQAVRDLEIATVELKSLLVEIRGEE